MPSCYGACYRLLTFSTLAWDFWSQMNVDALGLWPLLPTWTGACPWALTEARPTRSLGLRGWKPASAGRLQPLGHYDPLQHGMWVLDCYMETESSAPQT